ncbi:MAG: 1,4-alpha-glucan branching protein GlgB [Myxococcota bacterium]|jgi:1,4-alpha-glucan branching enzyme
MAGKHRVIYGPSLLTEGDEYLFKEGTHFQLYDKLGAHPMTVDGRAGTLFAVWAPNAESVSVIGDFNSWVWGRHPLAPRFDGSGIWEGFVTGVGRGALYKYAIRSRFGGFSAEKGDPMAFLWQTPPQNASVVWDLDYTWGDGGWMAGRHARNALSAPISIYEVHPGSWRRVPEEGNRSLTWTEMAVSLVSYVKEMGFTHVEFMPVMEHPFYGSWGYQTTGYFAPTSRYGTPQEFMALVDRLHQSGIGVILDWVPSHFPSDGHGLGYFDGTHLYEHSDPRQGFHPDWATYIFNHGRNEVREFLGSSAMFWLDRYHVDGLRVDAVASMLYLDYSRKEGEWVPNCFGGRENLEAVSFVKKLNTELYSRFPDTITIAEESTSWPMVSKPVYLGGLGFGAKWKMGWMNDTLDYMSKDPVYRRYNHDRLTFSLWYAFTENFVLPLSHDEVVHGKGSLFGRMPGDDWQKMANLRLLMGYMFTQPGKKLLFMGGEFGQGSEWNHESSLDWHLLDCAPHAGMRLWVGDLNRVYTQEPALHRLDCDPDGFQWVDHRDVWHSTLSYLRKDRNKEDTVLAILNFTPVPRYGYRIGVTAPGRWKELLNSDSPIYGGSGIGNYGGADAQNIPSHGLPYSLTVNLPPLGVLLFKREKPEGP